MSTSTVRSNGADVAAQGREIRHSAVIIGASGHIGGILGAQLLVDGYNVIFGGHHSVAGNKNGFEDRSHWCHVDVTKSESVQCLIDEAEKVWGPPYALVYCAGIVQDRPLLLTSDADWRTVLDINLTGAFYAIRAIARSMMVAGRGRIVLLGSTFARASNPGQVSYSTAKAGLEALARSAAVELGRYGVTCNVVAPGPVESRAMRKVPDARVKATLDSVPLRRLGRAEEVVAAIRFLLSEDAGYVTGHSVAVDGGLAASSSRQVPLRRESK